MKEKITNFGVLEFYQGEYRGGFEGLSDDMIVAAQNCLDVINNQTDVVEQAIKMYYDTKVKSDAEEDFCDYIETDDVNELSQVMCPQEMYIVDLKESKQVQDVKVGLYFECDWNEADGFGIRFDGIGHIIKIGTGDVIY